MTLTVTRPLLSILKSIQKPNYALFSWHFITRWLEMFNVRGFLQVGNGGGRGCSSPMWDLFKEVEGLGLHLQVWSGGHCSPNRGFLSWLRVSSSSASINFSSPWTINRPQLWVPSSSMVFLCCCKIEACCVQVVWNGLRSQQWWHLHP